MIKYYFKLCGSFIRIGILTLVQYPADTVVWLCSMIVREMAGFLGIVVIAKAIGSIAGWNLYEICVLYAMYAFVEAIGQAFLDNVWGIDAMVKNGDVDIYLIRPASVFVQIQGKKLHLQSVFSMVIFIIVFLWAMIGANIELNSYKILILLEYVICGTIINTGIYTIFNCLNFWVIQGEAIATLIQTCREFVKYPMTIFPPMIRFVFTYIFPLSFVAYYPALVILGKEEFPIWLILPIVAIIVLGVAMFVWKLSLKSYNSTGT